MPWSESLELEGGGGLSVYFVIIVGVNRLALRWARRREGGRGGGKRLSGGRGFPGFVFLMQSDRSQNANDVHVEVHRPRKERRKNGVTVSLMHCKGKWLSVGKWDWEKLQSRPQNIMIKT